MVDVYSLIVLNVQLTILSVGQELVWELTCFKCTRKLVISQSEDFLFKQNCANLGFT